MTEIDSPRVTYAAAGVDIAAGEQAVAALRPHTERARRPEVLGTIGGFAGLFKLKLERWREPVLASSTDGVGTKIAVAQAMDVHHTIGTTSRSGRWYPNASQSWSGASPTGASRPAARCWAGRPPSIQE
jgi:hypothetical protein